LLIVFFSAYLTITLFTGLRDEYIFMDSLLRFWLCFFLGAAIYLFSDQIIMRIPIVIVLTLIAVLTYGSIIFELTLQIALAYGVLWFALVPRGSIRGFNELGDYSYGLYIFAWPLQQTTVLLAPEISTHQLFLIVTPMVLLLAAASWHWIEQPALNARGRTEDWLRYRSGLGQSIL